MKYLLKAVSKDEGRFNLQHVVRREFDAFATDGHRLHRQLYLAQTTPHVVGATDLKVEDCPSIDIIIKELQEVGEVFKFKSDKKQIQKLEQLAKLSKWGLLKVNFKCIDADTLELIAFSHSMNINLQIKGVEFNRLINHGDMIPITVNLAYFVDALIVDTVSEVLIKANSLMVVRHHNIEGQFEAIIMGMK